MIYADPPWLYAAGLPHRGKMPYDCMTPAELTALPVARLAARDAVLFLWSTWPKLKEAISLGESWGFSYKTLGFVWIKRTTKSGALVWGLGNWARANTEPCLLLVRGRPCRVNKATHQIVEVELTLDTVRGPHSRKPPEVRAQIERLLGDVPRCELFARERAPGWDAWGDEVPGGSDFDLSTAADGGA